MRIKSLKLQQLEILNVRTKLGDEENRELKYLSAGFQGEIDFDNILESFIHDKNCIHIKDYRFNTRLNLHSFREGGSEVQIDSLLISGNRIYTFEIKNYSRDLIFGADDWHYLNHDVFKSPMTQVSRQNHELKLLLQKAPRNAEIFSSIVFINPNQTIYNLPHDKNILVRSNLKKFLTHHVQSNTFDLQPLMHHLERHQTAASIYDSKVRIDFDSLKPGVYCQDCSQPLIRSSQYHYSCVTCRNSVDTLSAARRLTEEMKILNPDWPVTAHLISHLSGGQISASYLRKMRRSGQLQF
ncbi:nuclease-related domain-containing protein [Corticicoccus populi]|uniref:Nuclease-related domain-containing protein n=1 Tax=Corticicoccus populi TaxID=1812821 RepID=A0ABW5WYB7_9STAP